MRVSIALASYNGAEYLPEQLQSFLLQERLPDELVVSDDGSTDGTLQVVEDFRARATFRVVLLTNQERLGFAGNFQRALEACTGDIIFLSDQDDVWYPGKIGKLVSFMHERNLHLGISDQVLVDSVLEPAGGTMLSNTRSMGLPDTWFVSGCCTAMTREFSDLALPLPSAASAHDSWFHRLADTWECRGVLDEPLQDYRRHHSNASNAASLVGRRRFVRGVNFPDFQARASAWSSERDLLGTIIMRSKAALDRGFLSADNYERIAKQSEEGIERIAARLELIDKPRALRLLGIWRLLTRRVGYGIRQAMSDVFSSRQR